MKPVVHLAFGEGTLCGSPSEHTSKDKSSEGRVCQACQKKMVKKLTFLQEMGALQDQKAFHERLKRVPKFARFVFSILPYGWQADLEIRPKQQPVARGSICRDWSDNGPSAKRFLNKLYKMAGSGEP